MVRKPQIPPHVEPDSTRCPQCRQEFYIDDLTLVLHCEAQGGLVKEVEFGCPECGGFFTDRASARLERVCYRVRLERPPVSK